MKVEERIRTALESSADSLRDPNLLSAEVIMRRGTRRGKTRRFGIGLAIALFAVGMVLVASLTDTSEPVVGTIDLADTKTPAEILADSVVTQEEFDQAGQAVVQCLAGQGLEGEFDSNDISFFVQEGGAAAALNECIATFMGSVVNVWSDENYDPVADFNFYKSVVECTSQATGHNYGEMTQDSLGYMSTVGHRTVNKAQAEAHDEYFRCFDQFADD